MDYQSTLDYTPSPTSSTATATPITTPRRTSQLLNYNATVNADTMRALLNTLNHNRKGDYGIIKSLRALQFERTLALEWSNLKPDALDSIWPAPPADGSQLMDVQQFRFIQLQDLGDIKYNEFYRNHLWYVDKQEEELLTGDCGAAAAVLYTYFVDRLVFAGENSSAQAWMWEELSRLWVLVKRNDILQECSEILAEKCRYYLNMILPQLANSTTIDYMFTRKLKLLNQAVTRVSADRCYMEEIVRRLRVLLHDPQFESTLNHTSSDLFPVRKGHVFNFKTLEKRVRTKADRFTFESPVDYIPDMHQWPNALKFINGLTQNNSELTRFIQDVSGYFLTGYTDLKYIFSCIGGMYSGKSSYFRVMQQIMGQYCTYISGRAASTIDDSDETCNGLLSARLALVPELKRYDPLSARRIIQLTSGGNAAEGIWLRQPFAREPKPYGVTAKVLLSAYSPMPIDDPADIAAALRQMFLPFNARFIPSAQSDQYCTDLMENHLDELFSWMSISANRYAWTRTLNIPDICKQVQQQYQVSLAHKWMEQDTW